MAAPTIASLPGPSTVAGYGSGLQDPNGVNQVAGGGQSSALNVTAAAVIKATAGRLCRISFINLGTTGGGFVLNDSATLAGATTANQIANIAYNASDLVAGDVRSYDIPCINGLVVSAVPTGGTPQLAISFN